jgi:signal transduction histidine kinase
VSTTVTRIRPRTVSVPLQALILGLPVVFALAGLGSWQFATSNRQMLEAHLAEVANTTALAMDAKLTGFEAAGLALAAMDDLQAGAVPASVQREAKRVADVLGVHIVVQEAAPPGVVLLNTLLPAGSRMIPRDEQPTTGALRAAVAAVIQTGKPRMADIFIGAVSQAHTMAVVVPVMTGDAVTRVVIIAFPSDNLADWLAEPDGDDQGFTAVRDGTGHVVALSGVKDQFAGQPVPPWARDLPRDHGIMEGLNMSGRHTLFAYQHLRLAPSFAVVVARPVHGVMSIIKGPAKWLIVSALAMIVLGILSLVAIWTHRETENAALQELNRLLSGVPAILYVNRVYPSGRFRRRFLSLSAERITGWPNKNVKRERTLTEKTDPTFLGRRNALFRAALETGRSQFEYQMRFADGTLHWMRVVGVGLSREPDGSGDVLGFITDITEERAMRDELRRAEKFAVLGEVAGRISHEMNQPMAAISMAAENGQMALDRLPVSLDLVREKFVRIEQQVERVISIIGQISTFSRRDIADDVTALQMDRVIHAALAVTEPKMTAARVSVRCDMRNDLPSPSGVAVLVEQIIVNLIVNACDAYEDQADTVERTVTITAFVLDGAYVLRVADHAGGIPADMLDRIFDPFVTSKPPGKGTGLGLSFCLASVARLGGKLTAANMDGGACFDVFLPIPARARRAAEAVQSDGGEVAKV